MVFLSIYLFVVKERLAIVNGLSKILFSNYHFRIIITITIAIHMLIRFWSIWRCLGNSNMVLLNKSSIFFLPALFSNKLLKVLNLHSVHVTSECLSCVIRKFKVTSMVLYSFNDATLIFSAVRLDKDFKPALTLESLYSALHLPSWDSFFLHS